MAYAFDAQLWRHDGDAAWYFLTLPLDVADDIEERFSAHAAGFGSVRVRVRVGSSDWHTSLFPDSKRKSYVLPMKKAVRVAEHLEDGAPVHAWIDVIAKSPT